MSRINFDTLAVQRPDLGRVWLRLSDWFGKHPRLSFVDLRRLARELPDVSTLELAQATQDLVQRGLLQPVYRVMTPDGVLLDRDFPSPVDVPARMPNRFHTQTFDTSEGDIVAGFTLDKSNVEG
jgi:hypothetical protein